MESEMNNTNWWIMIMDLQGHRLNELGAHTIAQSLVGDVKERTEYPLLTNRLYEPDWRDRFLAK